MLTTKPVLNLTFVAKSELRSLMHVPVVIQSETQRDRKQPSPAAHTAKESPVNQRTKQIVSNYFANCGLNFVIYGNNMSFKVAKPHFPMI